MPISLKPEPANAHERDSDVWRIAFRGYKERSLITATRSIIWRRIVLWSYTRFSDAMPPLKGTGAASYYARQITPLTNSAELRGFLFRGEQGIDYTPSTIHQAALNTTNFTVVMDRVVTVNPNFDSSDNPKVFERKDWIPEGKLFTLTTKVERELLRLLDGPLCLVNHGAICMCLMFSIPWQHHCGWYFPAPGYSVLV